VRRTQNKVPGANSSQALDGTDEAQNKIRRRLNPQTLFHLPLLALFGIGRPVIPRDPFENFSALPVSLSRKGAFKLNIETNISYHSATPIAVADEDGRYCYWPTG
jgi:hypothetical protein